MPRDYDSDWDYYDSFKPERKEPDYKFESEDDQ